jgi:hypothetical protein
MPDFDRFRESNSNVPEGIELSMPTVIPGQEELPLRAAGYREPDSVWVRHMIDRYGLGPEGAH